MENLRLHPFTMMFSTFMITSFLKPPKIHSFLETILSLSQLQKTFKNIVAKGEIAHDEQFPL